MHSTIRGETVAAHTAELRRVAAARSIPRGAAIETTGGVGTLPRPHRRPLHRMALRLGAGQ